MTKVEVYPDCQNGIKCKRSGTSKEYWPCMPMMRQGEKFMELFKFCRRYKSDDVGDKGIKTELLKYQREALFFVRCRHPKRGLEKRIPRRSTLLEQCHVPTVSLFRTYWQWEEAI